MKKFIAALLCLIMLLSLFSCNKESDKYIDDNSDKDSGSYLDTSTDPTTNTEIITYDSVLRVYRRIVDSYPIVNQNPLAVAAELGIQDEGEKESFLSLYSSIHQFFPGREQEDCLSPHYKLGCGYAIKDLNGDDVDELVLLTDEYRIIAIYSLINDIPTLLGSYIKKDLGWSFRNWIDAEGRIHVVRTDGLDLYHHSIFEISNGHLIELCTYGYDVFSENGVIVGKLYQTLHDNTVFITEQEVTEFNRKYGNPLNAGEAGNITMVSAKLTFTSLYTESEIALEMYEAAINGEIRVIDEQMGELSLYNCRFITNNVTVGECEFINKAILDMDGDGINEYIIQSPQRDHIILHYNDGKIYSYSFDFKSLFRLNTDGTFYWYSTESDLPTIGLSQITFNECSVVIKEIYRLKNVSELAEEYYLEGCQVTREEYLDYYNYNCKTWVQFSPFELSCQYPITAEEAWRIADNYLGNVDGYYGAAMGKSCFYYVVISKKPTDGSEYYTIVLQEFHFYHHADGWEISNPAPLYEHDKLVVNAITGACRVYVDSIPDAKG